MEKKSKKCNYIPETCVLREINMSHMCTCTLIHITHILKQLNERVSGFSENLG